MKTASLEKDRLEIKQRAVAKLRNEMKLEHKTVFFEPWINPIDQTLYYVYNYRYFEDCRKNQNWSDCADIFSPKIPSRERIVVLS